MTTPGTRMGAYHLIERLGAGGMGEVWIGEHTMLGRRAAIKLLHEAYSAQREIVMRFFNEARAATAISDPGIVQIFDFGRDAHGIAYIVMELLEGESLERRLRRCGRFAPSDAIRIVRQVAGSLAAAHERDIVHRDLKPDNIFLARDPEMPGGERTKLLDFGIAKLASEVGGLVTHTSAVMGTPTYMSPEQCRGAGQVDHRADIYSLGCVLFQLIAGRPPFEAEGAGELLAMHLREPAPRLSAHVPGIAAAIDDLVARCLAKDPAERFATARAFAAELGAVLIDLPVAPAPTATPSAAAPPTPTTLSVASSEIVASRPRQHRRRRTSLAAAVAACVVTACVLVFARGGATDEAVVPRPGVAPAAPADAPPPVDAPTDAAETEPVSDTAPPVDAAIAPPASRTKVSPRPRPARPTHAPDAAPAERAPSAPDPPAPAKTEPKPDPPDARKPDDDEIPTRR